jgi:integral membrane protein
VGREKGDRVILSAQSTQGPTVNETRPSRLFLPVSLAEGISFLVLLLIAMPLKYAANLPQAVMVVGMIHGLLFLGYVLLAFMTRAELGWNAKRLLWVLVMSVLPAGAFFAERSVKAEALAAVETQLVTA